MATGGSGDVLTGLVAAIACQGPDLFDAACLATWIHGRAGDLAAAALTEESMIASDLPDYIPAAMKEAVE
jgi:NAD(P)H-hydrate epimerase